MDLDNHREIRARSRLEAEQTVSGAFSQSADRATLSEWVTR